MGKVLVNEFSWSRTRQARFEECRRAYWFHYYLSWGGWEPVAPGWRRQLYILKKLSNRHTWAGSVVHSAIRGALMTVRAGRQVQPQRIVERVHRVMREDFVVSRARRYWQERLRKDFGGLVEHEYLEDVPPEAWRQSWETVAGGLSWFLSSRWLPLATALAPGDWLEVDLMDFERSIFFLDGVKVFAVPDFAYLEAPGRARLVDWKTGEPRGGYSDQVLAYALYLHHRYGLPLEGMRATLVYVNHGREVDVPIEPGALAAFHERFRASVAGMRGVLKHGNVPLDKEAFPRTEDLRVCARCPFRRPCKREHASREVAGLPAPPAPVQDDKPSEP